MMSGIEEIHEKDTAHGLVHLSIEQEDERLHQLGIRRELRKEFTNFSTISFALGILGLARLHFPTRTSLIFVLSLYSCSASIASTFNTPILLGGPATAVWAWFLGSFGCIAIGASVAGE